MFDLIMFIALIAYFVYDDIQKGRRQGYKRPWWTRKRRRR